MWSVADAKAQLSELLRRARSGEPQFIGTQEPCVVISLESYREKFESKGHDGSWLIEHASRAEVDIQLPPRGHNRLDAVFGGSE
jgi:prevent-host-death family protein